MPSLPPVVVLSRGGARAVVAPGLAGALLQLDLAAPSPVAGEASPACTVVQPPIDNNCSMDADLEALQQRLAGIPAIEWSLPYAGCILAPWPNRLAGGTYSVAEEGVDIERSLPVLNEPGRRNALHGLLHGPDGAAVFSVVSQSKDGSNLVMRLPLGKLDPDFYPFNVELEVSYTLTSPSELAVAVRAVNHELTRSAPVGLGTHCYFKAPPPSSVSSPPQCSTLATGSKGSDEQLFVADRKPVDNWKLTVAATHHVHVDPDTMIPTGEPDDLRCRSRSKYAELVQADGLALQDVTLDDAFIVEEGKAGASRTVLREASSDFALVIEQDTTGLPFVQCYTPPGRTCVAIEPMSCLANSFNDQPAPTVHLAAGSSLSTRFVVKLECA